MGVLHQAHAQILNMKRVSRLVILPDYQGIGLGTKFLDFIANYYRRQNFEFYIKTSAKNMIMSLLNSNNWKLNTWGFTKNPNNGEPTYNKTVRSKCKTASFKYIKKH